MRHGDGAFVPFKYFNDGPIRCAHDRGWPASGQAPTAQIGHERSDWFGEVRRLARLGPVGRNDDAPDLNTPRKSRPSEVLPDCLPPHGRLGITGAMRA
jgi:hypothetical protein